MRPNSAPCYAIRLSWCLGLLVTVEVLWLFVRNHYWPKTIKHPVISPAKGVYLGPNKESQLGTYNLWPTTDKGTTVREQRQESFFYRRERRFGRGCYKRRVLWRELEVQSIGAFHWLNCCWTRRNSSFVLLGSKIVTFFLLELQGISLPVGSAIEVKW